MSPLRVRYLLAGLAVAAAFLLGAVCDWGQLSAVVAPLGPGDALLGVLGLVLAAMTGAAGVLIAADVRADTVAAQAWHNVQADAFVIAAPAETASIDRVDALYVAGPQDEGLRRILLAHRFMVPVPPPNAIGSLAPKRDDVRVVPGGTSIKPEIQAVRTVCVANSLGETLAAPAAAQRKLGPQQISSNAKSALGRNQTYAVRKMPVLKRIANANTRWDWPVFATAPTSRVPGSDFGFSAIMLGDRNGRDETSAPSDVAPEPETTAQPCCRGPPHATFRRHVADGAAHLGKPFREIDRSRAIPPADLVVIDNLGDRIPVYQAELEVLEAYLEDVLDDMLGSFKPVTKST